MTTDECRWCHGTGWAPVPDQDMGDVFEVPCPAGCLIPLRPTEEIEVPY